jgi:hypothetical protein
MSWTVTHMGDELLDLTFGRKIRRNENRRPTDALKKRLDEY